MDTKLKVFKAFDPEEYTAYAFFWEDIDPTYCHVWWRWKNDSIHWSTNLIGTIKSDPAWSETSLLDVLVCTGLTEIRVFKQILDEVPGGWKRLHSNLPKIMDNQNV